MASHQCPPESTFFKVKLLDGGMGDEIHKRLNTNEVEWSAPGLLDPQNHGLVAQLHREFVLAGADYITTCNFSVRKHNGFNFDQVRFACEHAGRIARSVADEFSSKDRQITVLGSLPPLLDCFRRSGGTGMKVADTEEYMVMIEALRPNCDVFIGETLSSIAEAEQVLNKAYGAAPGTPCWISFSVTSKGTLYSGESPSNAVQTLLQRNQDRTPSAILFNCSSPEAIAIALTDVREDKTCAELLCKTKCELGAYPNRYLPVPEEWTTLDQPARIELTPERFAEFGVKECVGTLGVSIVGGCCGISPEYITALRLKLDACPT